jgi:hypothetical protein
MIDGREQGEWETFIGYEAQASAARHQVQSFSGIPS